MGIRSDVALGMTKEVYNALTEQSKQTIGEWFDGQHTNEEGDILFTVESVKWYVESYADLSALVDDLNEQDYEQFILICATSDYPNSEEYDMGDWHDNPWQLYKYVSCEIQMFL